MPASVLTSAAGVIALLDETQPQLQAFALGKLNGLVDTFWAEISESVRRIEELYEDEAFHNRQLAALVASKVYYHLGSFGDALEFALGAGELFNVNENSEFVHTIVSKCIDRYIALRNPDAAQDVLTSAGVEQAAAAGGDIDARLVALVDRMFERCLTHGSYRQAIGIALESRRIDIFQRAIAEASDTSAVLGYCMNISNTLITSRAFRDSVLAVLVDQYMCLPEPDLINVCQCLIFLNNPERVAQTLRDLLEGRLCGAAGAERGVLVAYQIAFDVFESATQQFVHRVVAHLLQLSGVAIPEPTAADAAPEPTLEKDSPIARLYAILTGEVSLGLELEFLLRNNHSDLLILKNTKLATQRNSICHGGTVIANALMHAGTGIDTFLRQDLAWVRRAAHWAKFNVTASLGVVHKGHIKESFNILSPYLPKGGSESGAGPFAEGGGLFALGLIHANHGKKAIPFLVEQLKNATHSRTDEGYCEGDIVRHGGSLGLGLAAMGTATPELFGELRAVLNTDSAVAGEAAGIGMGLIMLGTGHSECLDEMLRYAHDTAHEKIIRGLAIGMALMLYEREELADAHIELMAADKDPVLRYGAMLAVSLAYAGTGNNKAINRLLHVAVSDVSDDVRRAAVIGLGFVLFRDSKQVPGVVSLLSESYNPHVRYGAALALGVSCAATGSADAIELLEPLSNDPVDFVRQGAMIALAMVLIQQSDAQTPKAASTRKLFEKVIGERHEDVMAKFGAVLAQGLIEAGGRNVTISLQSRIGHTRTSSVVGLLLFTQHWFWHSMTHFISLAFTPTTLIALNKNLKMPQVKFHSAAKPSQFAYPPALVPPKVETKEKVTTAVLSYTKAKSTKRKADKAAAIARGEAVSMDTSVPGSPLQSAPSSPGAEEKSLESALAEKAAEKKEDVKEVEPDFELLTNPARIVPDQVHVTSLRDERYRTVLKSALVGGIVIVEDNTPELPEELIEIAIPTPKVSAANTVGDEADEPEPPQPFEYTL
ncbi:proteasome 26S subunit [Capsaspora owczarzaki ATCC 30864]|uniref:Proteasome 26S subunit n=1 Tax=Capsaspora owczarzaki (strain ATCC 30864) TaxID=595528 RepID=A0A0D2VP45_CAPO3|nr:proteasome 26S subunit [Capsaspora owczarzaki ATCC 30864]KJE92162.1 proteasome 26S subunit [Capsaspora owczarzaki ATCC 30864]|eukprot:XP_004364020.2 proteasome 26S subunit [Capsaspora owczarzaki ATCC 30864]